MIRHLLHRSSSAAAGVPGCGLALRFAASLVAPGDADNPTGVPGFVFDIDGVLIRGRTVLPAAEQAMQKVRHGAPNGGQ